jgi:hypothetical protein
MRFAISTRNVINRRKTRAILKKKKHRLVGLRGFWRILRSLVFISRGLVCTLHNLVFFVEAQRNVEIVLVGLHEKKANVPGSIPSCGKNKQKPRSLV